MDETTYTNSHVDVLSKDDPLELNDEEVDQLFDIRQDALKRLARDGVVALRAHLAGKTIADGKLANQLGRRRQAKKQVQHAEDIAEDRDVAQREDERDDGSVGHARGARVLPGEQVVEEGVVVCQGLAGGRLGLGSVARGGEVAELVARGLRLNAGLFCHWAVRDALDGLRSGILNI